MLKDQKGINKREKNQKTDDFIIFNQMKITVETQLFNTTLKKMGDVLIDPLLTSHVFSSIIKLIDHTLEKYKNGEEYTFEKSKKKKKKKIQFSFSIFFFFFFFF